MNDSTGLTSRPARIPSAAGWAIRSALGAMIATSVALAALLVAAILIPSILTDNPPAVCGVLGALLGAGLKGPGSKLARVIGGAVGGVVAAWFAFSAGEMVPPLTLQWVYVGGAFAALFALPAAAAVGGLIGLLIAVSRSSRSAM